MSSSKKDSRSNYWSPLQCLPDSESESMDVIVSPNSSPKVIVPPIKVLQKQCDYVHDLMKTISVSDYAIKRMSISIKIICDSMESYNSVLVKLKQENCQFFTHDLKCEKAFKAVLYGLGPLDTNSLKSELIKFGLKCKETKMINKKYEHYSDTIYIVFWKVAVLS